MRGGVLTVVLVLLCSAGTARADKVDLLVKQLTRGDYKLRLSAALKLSRFRDPRAVRAMARALRRDDRDTIRRVAALSLSRMVDESLSLTVRKRAIAALEYAAKKDSDKTVRANAARSLEKLEGLGGVADAKVFLHIGKPADLTRAAPRDAPKRMHLAVRRTLRSHAPTYAQEWPTGKLPTKRELTNKGAKAFFVGASVSDLRVRKSSGRAEVRCSVSVRVSPWEGRDGKERWRADQTASATGTGKVVGAGSSRGIAASKRDCLLAVVEQITARQVVPFLRKLAN